MKGRKVYGEHGKPDRFYIDGREVTAAEFNKAFPSKPIGTGQGLVGFKPLHSEALAVCPADVPEAMADAKKKGVPVEFDGEGRPVFTSSRQFRQYAKAYKFRHKGY